MVKIENRKIVQEIILKSYDDARGSFIKYFEVDEIGFNVNEIFASSTKMGFVRGIHLQVGNAQSTRVVLNWKGAIFSVFLDLRRESPTLGQYESFTTESTTSRCFLVPPGVAHGFQALSDCDVLYVSNKKYISDLDKGVHPGTIGVSWPLEIRGISDRDSNLPSLQEYLTTSK